MRVVSILFAFSFLFVSCGEQEEEHNLQIYFHHYVDEFKLSDTHFSNDSIIFQNNETEWFSVRRLLYVLSDIVLFFEDGSTQILDDYFFINTEDNSTLTKSIKVSSLCSGISFTVGFSSYNNIDNFYINDPNGFHDQMLWPNSFGLNAFQGGYHYMKLEGKCVANDEELFYNVHTGPLDSQDYSIPISTLYTEPTLLLSLNMNIKNWFNDPIYNINYYGSGIMGNEDAQQSLHQNGLDVFSVESL